MQPNNPYGPQGDQQPYAPYPQGPGGGPQSYDPYRQPQQGYTQPQQPINPGNFGYGVAPTPYGNGPQFGPPQPPPPQPEVPFFLDPNGPYGPLHPMEQAPPPRSKKPLFVIAGIMVLLVGIFTLVALMSKQGTMTADEVFNNALQHALSTGSYTEKTTIGQNNQTIQYDLASVSEPRINSSVKLGADKLTFTGYGDLKNTYVSFSETDGTNVANSQQGKWIQIRKGGTLPDTDKTLEKIAPLADPQSLLLSAFIRGSFSDTDRQSMLSLIQEKRVYSYDAGAANTSVIGGQAVYVYEVRINTDALSELDQKAANLFGISDKAVEASEKAGKPSTATFYISIEGQQLVKMTYKNGNSSVTSEYSNFEDTKLTTEPVADLQWSDVQIASAQTKDGLRKLQVGSIGVQLESFYAKNKYYPSLANLNDPAWVKANFAGFSADRLKDPAATDATIAALPVKGQFSYQVGLDKSLAPCTVVTTCKYFKLSAVLDDGTVFSRESI